MDNKKLLQVRGGAFNASFLNALSRGAEVLYKIGRSFGTTMKMLVSGKRC